MDWQWVLTVILIPAGIAVWEVIKGYLKQKGEARIAHEKAVAQGALEKERARLALEEKQVQAALEAATAKLALAKQETEAALESQRDDREHKQRRESLELTTALGNQSFKDDQITMMAAEAQSEAGAYSQFFREQYAKLIEQIVTKKEFGESQQVQEKLVKQVVTIDTYLRSIIQELRDDRRRVEEWESSKNYEEMISALRDEVATLQARLGPKKTE